MARIPSYDSPQVQAQPLPGVNISDAPARDIAAAGGAMARGVGAIGDVFGQIAAHERGKANKAAQLDIENQFAELETSALHAPDTGLLNRQGKDAIGIGEQFAPMWKKRADEIVSKAPGHLREWAAQQGMSRQTDAQRIVMRHSTQEGQRYYVSQADTLMANAVNSAGLNYLDPNRVEQEAARAQIAADQRNALEGGSEEMGALLRSKAASLVHRGVLDRLIAEDPSAAVSRLERVRGQMTAADLADVESTLRPVLADADAGARIDAWINGQPTPAGAMPMTGAARSMKDAEAVARASVGRTVGLESGGKADAKNPNSSATGAGQFIDATWLDIMGRNRPELVAGKSKAEVLAMRNDPALSRQMAEAYAVENARGLLESGLPVTEQTVYMAHHFGLGGARALLRAPPDTPVSRLLPAKDIAANPYLKGKTVAELIANHQQRAGESPTATNSSRTPPARTADGKVDWIEIERRAQSEPNPILRDRILSRARSMAAVEARAQTEADKARSERIIAAINADPAAPLAKRLSPQDYAAAAADGKLPSLESYRQNMIEGTQRQDDFARVDELERMAALEPEKFAQQNIAGEADKFSTATLSSLLELQKKAAKPGAKEDQAAANARIGDMFTYAGVGTEADSRGKGSEEKNAGRARHRGELRVMYRKAIQEYTQSHAGKAPDPETADKIARNVAKIYTTRVVSSDSHWFGPDTPVTMQQENERRRKEGKPLMFEATAQYMLNFTEQQRESVRAAYRAKYKVDPTDGWVNSYLLRATKGKAP